MEQVDSLKQELQNLSRIQLEQTNILKNMSEENKTAKALNDAKQMHKEVQFNTPVNYTPNGSSYAPYATNNYGTPANYNYNPFPSGGPNDISFTHGMPSAFAQNTSTLFGSQGKFGFLGRVNPGTQYSLASRDLIAMDHTARVSQSLTTGAGALGSILATTASSAAIGGLGGLAVGLGAGAGVGLLADKGIDEIKKETALKKYIYKNSNKFIDSYESDNERGVAGFSRKQSYEAADFVRTMNDEFFIKDDEMMNLLQKYTEGGLLKDTKDLDSFKEKMGSLTKTVKEGALMLNETYDNIADLLAELRKAGIDEKDWKSLLSSGSILGGLTGQDGSNLVQDIIDFVKNLNAGTGNSNSSSTSRVEDITIYLNDYYESLKKKDSWEMSFEEKSNKDMILNLGGPTEANKYMAAAMEQMSEHKSFTTPSLYYFDYNEEKKDFELNRDKFNEYKKGKVSYRDAYAEAEKKLQSYQEKGLGDALIKWENNSSSYLKRYLKGGDLSDALASSVQMLALDPDMKAQGFDMRSIMGSYFGVEDSGTQNLLSGYWGHKSANSHLKKRHALQSAWQQNMAGTLSQTPSFTEMVSSSFEKVGDFFSKGFTSFNEGLGSMLTKTWDNITGLNDKIPSRFDKEFTTRSNLEKVSYSDIVEETKNTNDILSSGFATLETLVQKGYSMDPTLSKFLEDKFNTSDKSVNYSREIITDWNEITSDLQEKRGIITEQASKASLSETIVAALHKFNESKPSNEKIDVSEAVTKLGTENFQYGGNTKLAMASLFSSRDEIDRKLNEGGYNTGALRRSGAQEELKKVNLEDLGLDEKLTEKINKIFNTNIGVNNNNKNTQTVEGTKPQNKDEVIHMDLSKKSNVTAEQLNEFIASRTKDKPDSVMKGQGQAIIDAANKYGIDPVFLTAQMGGESKWGASQIVKDKFNFTGWGAIDSNPYGGAHKYGNVAEGIDAAAKNTSENYIYGKEGQNTIYKFNRSKSGTHNYTGSNDPKVYDNLIGSIMMEMINKFDLKYDGKTVEEEEEDTDLGFGVTTDKKSVVKSQTGEDITNKFSNDMRKKYSGLTGNENSKGLGMLRKALGLHDSYGKIIKGKLTNPSSGFDTSDVTNVILKELRANGVDAGEDGDALINYFKDFSSKFSSEIAEFAAGNVDGEWGKKTTAEKSEIFEILKLISPENLEKNILKGDSKNIYTKEEKKNLGILGREGNVDGSVINENSSSKNHVAFLDKENPEGLSPAAIGIDDYKYTYSYSSKFMTEGSDLLNSQDKFIKESKDLQTIYGTYNREADKMQSDTFVADAYRNDKLKKGVNAIGLQKDVDSYLSSVKNAMSSGDYSNLDELLKENEQLRNQRNQITSNFNDGGAKFNNLEKGYGVNRKDALESDVINNFAKNYLGMDKKDYLGNIGEYNKEVMGKAQMFYNSKMGSLKEFIYGDKESDSAQQWSSLSMGEKSNTIEMLKLLQSIVGKGNTSEIDTVEEIEYNLRENGKELETEAVSEYENMGLRHLRKDKDGAYVYDPSYDANNEEDPANRRRGLDDYNEWRKGGQKLAANEYMGRKLSELTGESVDIDSNAGIEELKNTINLEMDKVVAENMKKSKEALDLVENIKSGKESALGTLTGEKRNELANAIQKGDIEYLKSFNENNAEAQVDPNIIESYIKLTESINGVNLQGFQKMIDMLDNISDIAKDTAGTSMLLNQSLDKSSQKEFEAKVRTNSAATLGADSEIGKALLDGKGTLAEIAKVLNNGGEGEIAGKEVKLSSDDIQALAAAMASAIDDTLTDTFTNKEKRSGFLESGMYKAALEQSKESGGKVQYEVKDKETGELKKASLDLDEAVTTLQAVEKKLEQNAGKNTELEQEYSKQRDDLIGGIVELVQESTQKVGDIEGMLGESEQKVNDAADSAKTTAETFATTLATYDSSIKTAIGTMESTIKTLNGKIDSLPKNSPTTGTVVP